MLHILLIYVYICLVFQHYLFHLCVPMHTFVNKVKGGFYVFISQWPIEYLMCMQWGPSAGDLMSCSLLMP